MNFNRPLVLASTSPRRQFLMRESGFQFKVENPAGDESFPSTMPVENVPAFLAEKKAQAFKGRITDEIFITADTIVILDNGIMNKPENEDEAIGMLSSLSGRTHLVITAVRLTAKEKQDTFDVRSEVTFRKLTQDEIRLYVENYKPYDKAGAYGAQDCLPENMNPCSQEEIEFLQAIKRTDLIEKTINRHPRSSMAAIKQIAGSYFNVMGLPIHQVYNRLHEF